MGVGDIRVGSAAGATRSAKTTMHIARTHSES